MKRDSREFIRKFAGIMELAVKRILLLPGNSAPSWIVETNITQEISKGDATCTIEPKKVEKLFIQEFIVWGGSLPER